MLQRYSEVFRSVLMASDAALVALAWLAAYTLRFHGNVDAPLGVPALRPYLELLLAIVPVYTLIFRARGLYRPWRAGTLWQELVALVTANGIGLLALIAVSFFARSYFYPAPCCCSSSRSRACCWSARGWCCVAGSVPCEAVATISATCWWQALASWPDT